MLLPIILSFFLCGLPPEAVDGEVRYADFFPHIGHSKLPASDYAHQLLWLDTHFPFFGQKYNTIYINTDGSISFATHWFGTQTCVPLQRKYRSIMPFCTDFDTRNAGSVYYHQMNISDNPSLIQNIRTDVERANPEMSEVAFNWLLIATWVDVRHYATSQKNTFQAILATDGNYSFVIFYYNFLGWTNNEGARAGYDAGDGVNLFMLPGSCTDDVSEFAKGSNIGVSGKWVFRVDGQKTSPTSATTTTATPLVQLRFQVSTATEDIMERQQVLLECMLQQQQQSAMVANLSIWRQFVNGSHSERAQALNNQSVQFLFDPIRAEDAGRYLCVANLSGHNQGQLSLSTLVPVRKVHASGLPEEFFGKWVLNRSENLDAYLDALGNWVTFAKALGMMHTLTIRRGPNGTIDWAETPNVGFYPYKAIELGKEYECPAIFCSEKQTLTYDPAERVLTQAIKESSGKIISTKFKLLNGHLVALFELDGIKTTVWYQ